MVVRNEISAMAYNWRSKAFFIYDTIYSANKKFKEKDLKWDSILQLYLIASGLKF